MNGVSRPKTFRDNSISNKSPTNNTRANKYTMSDASTSNHHHKKDKKTKIQSKTFLEEVTVARLFSTRGAQAVHDVEDSEKVSDAFDLMKKYSILSVPVWDSMKKRYNGFIDIVDILCFALQTADDSSIKRGEAAGFMEFTDINSKIKQHTCGELINRSQRDTYLQVSEDASLDTAISVMAQFKAYRVPVVSGEDNDLMGVLSQSLIVKFLAEHMDRFPDLDKKTIKELNIGFRTVISVNKENSVKDTLLQIRDNRVGGIAVVDNSNKLVGTISASDLKSIGFGADFLGAMYMPISWLLSQTPRQKDRPYPLVLKPDVTIAQVLKTFDETKVHRLFIVNEDMILQGVVTLTDVLQMFHDYGLKKQK